jgi:uncharacterized membrane protein HdeD (DUF308 family)
MIVLGLFAIWAAASDMFRKWVRLASGSRTCDVPILASGVLLSVAGAWLLLTRDNRPQAAGLGSLAAAMFAGTLAVGLWSGVIPCSGPS